MISIKKAERANLFLKMSMAGISGTGKTYTSLLMAEGLGKKTLFVDTEFGKSQLYADRFNFDIVDLRNHHPNNYIEVVNEAERLGYDTLIIDSLSHLWMGEDGILQLVEKQTAMMKGNSMLAWGKINPLHNTVIRTILGAKLHCIVTLRQKNHYVKQMNDKGKEVMVRQGTEAIQKEGLEYEFDLNTEMDLQHNLLINKSRLSAITDTLYQTPGIAFAQLVKNALLVQPKQVETPATIDKPAVISKIETIATETTATDEPIEYVSQSQYVALWEQAKAFGHDASSAGAILKARGLDSFKTIPIYRLDEITKLLTSAEGIDMLNGDYDEQ